MLKRPNGSDSNSIPVTQFFHEWVHYLNDNGYDIADASRGKPSYPKDADAIKAVEEFYKNIGDVFPYGKNALGELKYREQAAQGFTKEYNVGFHPDDIIFTPGGQFGISMSFYLIEQLFPNSVIVAPNPWYVNHHDIANMFGAHGFSAIPQKSRFHSVDVLSTKKKRITAEQIEQAIYDCRREGKKIGAFLFCNPANPQGLVTGADEWKRIVKILEKVPEAIIMVDEAFAEVVFSKDFNISIITAVPHLKDRIILLRSGTKALGFPGERYAVMAVPQKFLPIFTAFQSRLIGNTPLSSQAGMAKAMQTMSIEKKSKISDYYYSNYKFLSQKIDQNKNIKRVFDVEGGFYCLYDLSFLKGRKIPQKAREILKFRHEYISNDVDISVSLMFGFDDAAKQGVASIPGSAFGIAPDKCIIRISHSSYKEELQKIGERLGFNV